MERFNMNNLNHFVNGNNTPGFFNVTIDHKNLKKKK